LLCTVAKFSNRLTRSVELLVCRQMKADAEIYLIIFALDRSLVFHSLCCWRWVFRRQTAPRGQKQLKGMKSLRRHHAWHTVNSFSTRLLSCCTDVHCTYNECSHGQHVTRT